MNFLFQNVVILDLSTVSYMDQSAGKNLKEWIIRMDKNFQTAVLLAGPSGRTEAMMFKVEIEMSGVVFPTIVDAVKHVEGNYRIVFFANHDSATLIQVDWQIFADPVF